LFLTALCPEASRRRKLFLKEFAEMFSFRLLFRYHESCTLTKVWFSQYLDGFSGNSGCAKLFWSCGCIIGRLCKGCFQLKVNLISLLNHQASPRGTRRVRTCGEHSALEEMESIEPHFVDEEDFNKVSSSSSPLPPDISQSHYSYRKLENNQSIRLIALMPCTKLDTDQRLKCNLEVVELAANPSYAALSYTWGENVFPETLICDNGVLKITKNVHAALSRFRLPNRHLYIWVDAVCINQADDAEKSQQIPLMADIYS
jgi:hypothetical protein